MVHFHGLLFFAWSLYFAFQSWLAASGKIARHRAIGMIGVSLATAMTIFGFLVAVNAMKRSAAAGMTDDGIAFAIVPLSGIRSSPWCSRWPLPPSASPKRTSG